MWIPLALPAAACGAVKVEPSPPPAPSAAPAAVSLAAAYGPVTEYALYYQAKNVGLSLYEPENGCYLGAYVLSNKAINYDMKEFDRLTGKKHAVAMYNMTLGDAFPDEWVVSCVAALKTPFLSVRPQKAYDLYDKSALNRFAAALAKYHIPMFVEFFPDPEAENADPEMYKEYFAYARDVFNRRVPSAALVWSVSSANVLDCERYYPGDKNADWVGLSVYEPLAGDGYADFFPALDYFYYTFQKSKPVMLSRFAVSHYTSENRVYKTQEASDEIARVYAAAADGYPRLKLINYMDFNGIALSGDNRGDDFSVSDSDRVTAVYAAAVSDNRFLTVLDARPHPDAVVQWMRSPFPVYGRGDKFFFPEDGFRLDLNISGLRNPTVIDGADCFDIDVIRTDPNRSLSVDEDGRAVWVGNGG